MCLHVWRRNRARPQGVQRGWSAQRVQKVQPVQRVRLKRSARPGQKVQSVQAALPSAAGTEDGTWYPAEFDGKTLVVNGVSYQALLISGCVFVERCVADFLTKASAAGFPVLFLDQKPSGISGAAEEENRKFRELAAGFETVPSAEAGVRAAVLVRPQVKADPAWERLVTYHYQNGADLYLLLNEHAAETYRGSVTLCGVGTPVRYYP